MAKRWTSVEEELLLSLLKLNTIDECSVKLQRTTGALTSRLEKIALEMYKNEKSLEDIQELTKLPIEIIHKISYLYSLPNHNAEWDDSQDEWLRKYIIKYGSKECAAKMGRTECEINTRILSVAIDDLNHKCIEKISKTLSMTSETFLQKIELMKNYVPFNELDKIGNPPYYAVLNGRYKGIYDNIEGLKMATVGLPKEK